MIKQNQFTVQRALQTHIIDLYLLVQQMNADCQTCFVIHVRHATFSICNNYIFLASFSSTKKRLATSIPFVWYRSSTAVFMCLSNSTTSSTSFLDLINGFATSMNETTHCHMSSFALVLECRGVFSVTFFIFLFLACYSSSRE